MRFYSRAPKLTAALAGILCTGFIVSCIAVAATVKVPDPQKDEPRASVKGEQVMVLAGGCFWGVQAVFEHVKGVKNVWAGYSGGASSTAEYEMVSTGRTGHAESVQVTYDPSEITYGQLLKVFFSVAHDPTELNRQGPDEGTQYRSAIFFASDSQKEIAQAYIDQLNQGKVFKHSIVTQLTPLKGFYRAEAYHQDYLIQHPDSPYIMFNDLPKLSQLKKQWPDLYVGK